MTHSPSAGLSQAYGSDVAGGLSHDQVTNLCMVVEPHSPSRDEVSLMGWWISDDGSEVDTDPETGEEVSDNGAH